MTTTDTAPPIAAPDRPATAPAPATRSAPGRTLTINGTAYPLILPNIRDPRLHVASVIITIHVLGQVGLHFQVSVVQILAAILTCAILEIAITFRQSRIFVWPASAMLTGSGVALILRVVGTPADDPWNTYAWYVFAGVAGLSLLTKYVIKYRGSHVFNPSNIGLVVAFVVLGSGRVEPLDFWWAPLNVWMLAAYAVIITGGILITRRLKLLALAATFWLTFSTAIGLLSASGHCMTTNWAFAPVCGFDFWRVIVTSPEVLIFLFFMITDPKTVPAGRVGRIAFGFLVGIASALLMAPQTNEWGTKVALLSGLVVLCAARPVLDRLLPAPKSPADTVGTFATRLATLGRPGAGTGRAILGIGLVAVALLTLGAGIVAAGTPARGDVAPDAAELLSRLPRQVDPGTMPVINVGQDVKDWDSLTAGAGMQEVVVTLGQNLEIEAQALLRKDGTLLTAVDHGDRLKEMQANLAAAQAGGPTMVDHYQIDTLDVSLREPFGVQSGLSLAFLAHGTKTEETYAPDGSLQSRTVAPFVETFDLRRATGARWLNVAVQQP